MNKISHFKILFCILITSILNTYNKTQAQFVHSEVYDLSNGLSSLEINDLYQDSKGYLWIATQAGLVRYNGYEFKEINAKDKIIGKQIQKILEDRKNRLWVISENNTLTLVKDNQLQLHALSNNLQKIAENRAIAALDLDTQDSIYIALQHNKLLSADYTLYKAALTDTVWTKDNSLFTNNPNGVFYYPITRSISLTQKPFLLGLQNNNINANNLQLIVQSPFYQITAEGNCHCAQWQQNIYCINEKQYLQFDRNGTLLAQDNFIDTLPAIENLYIDKKGNAWIGTAAGAYFYEKIDFKKQAQIYFEEQSIKHIFQDREGSYWLSSRQSGLIFMPYRDIQVQTVSPYSYQNHILKLSYIPPFIHALTSTGMVYKITNQTVLSTYYNQSASPCYNWYYAAEKGEIFLGSGRSIDVETGNSAYPWQNNPNENFQALCFRPYKQGELLIGHDLGLIHWDIIGRQVLWHSKEANFYKKVLEIYPLNTDTFLLATTQGLYTYFSTTKTILPFPKNIFTQSYIATINHYEKLGQNHLIIGTQGEGLWFENQDKEWINLNTNNGLSSNFINKILVENNTWWIASNKGLDKIIWADNNYTQLEHIINYSTKNGLPNNGIHDILLHNQNLLLATDAGIVSFSPQHLNKTPESNIPPIHISNISINGKDTLLTDSFNLTYWERNIQIQFLGIRFREKGTVNYRYLLEGKDSIWNITPEKSIQYTNLEVGSYTFHVSTQGDDGIWHPQGAKIYFNIKAPFWQENWFYFGIGSLAFFILIVIIYQIRKRNRLQRQLWASKQNALHAQMNPHFIFNAMNSILYFVRQNDKRQATSFLASFSILIRRILDNSKHSLISLKEEVETLDKYLELEALRLSNPTDDFKIEVDNSLNKEAWKVPPMLIQPLIENSIVHGLLPKMEGIRKLLVTIQPYKKKLRITVEDNGIGRIAAAEIRKRRNITHTSYGAQNIEERVKILNQMYGKRISIAIEDLYDKDKKAIGTKIIVLIPEGLAE